MEQESDRSDGGGIAFLSAPPPQVAERIRRQPECRLLWAVLEDGMETYLKYRCHRPAREAFVCGGRALDHGG